jgi:hypothetical protein
MTSNNFDISRMLHFTKRQLILNISSMWIAFGAVFGTLLFISILEAYFAPLELLKVHNLYITVMFIAGYFFSSRIFSEMNRPQKTYLFLTLPVSTAEKLLGSWLVSGPLFAAVFSAMSWLIYELGKMIAGVQHPSLDVEFNSLFSSEYWRTAGIFLVTQTIFFLGACTFKGNNFLKTLLTLFIVTVIISLYSGMVARLILHGALNTADLSPGFREGSEEVIPVVWRVFFWYVFGPFMLLVSYFKLKEREI